MKAIISGISGQDGSYLAEYLLDKGYEVWGFSRRTASHSTSRIDHLIGNKDFHYTEGDLTDPYFISELIGRILPDEFYNLAAQSVTEDSLIPVRSGTTVKYRSFKDLWQEQMKKKREVRLENGYVEVIDIPKTTNAIQAMGYWNGFGTWFNITQISRHRWNDKVVKLKQKFGSVTVTPNHSILNTLNQICKPEDNPWLLSVRNINSKPHKDVRPIKLTMSGSCLKGGDYIWKNEKGKTGKVKKQVITKTEKIDLFSFLGAFVTEGHTSYNIANNTYTVNISQQSEEWLLSIKDGLMSFFDGNTCICTHKKEGYEDVKRLEIKSKYLYELMRKWCGTDSKSKRLPDFVLNSSNELLSVIFNKMIEGDGCLTKDGWRYTTCSYELSCQLSMVITRLGYNYTVNEETNENGSVWHFRSCESYQPNQGDKRIEYLDYDGWVYDISVDEVHNFTVGVGNIVVHNSHVHTSFSQPSLTNDINYSGVLNALNAIKNVSPETKMLNAGTSEQFGKSYSVDNYGNKFQDENTVFTPQSPYAISKLAAYHACRLYREAYGLFICSSILGNHESPRRGENFVTRKITLYLGRLIKWLKSRHDNFTFTSEFLVGQEGERFPKLRLGNLDAQRDWGHARAYVQAQHLMLQQSEPDDYVIGTGETRTVREFVKKAFELVGLNYEEFIFIDPEFFRPGEVDYLLMRPAKAKEKLGWSNPITFDELIKEMVEHDQR